tara:strand:- start:5384 stop:8206 length:2823 start_codon:yes stop_codon:yes gene_type:complete
MANVRAGDTERYMEKAREASLGTPDPLELRIKHPQNREYALFFMYMTDSAVKSKGPDAQWPKSLQKIVGSICKLPMRVRSLEHANAIHGVGPKTLELFRKYLTKYPPAPPTDQELRQDELVAEATRAAKDAEKARKKAERDARKEAKKNEKDNANGTHRNSQTETPNISQKRNRYHPRGVDDDIIAIDLMDTPEAGHQNRNQNRPPSPPPAKRAKKKLAAPKKKTPSRWEPGYRTAPFALLVTLHKLSLQGQITVDKKALMDKAEESDLSAQGIYPKGNEEVRSAAGGAHGYRGDKAQFSYSGWTCFNKQLTKAPKGWPAPMVMTWSNPINIRLTDEGTMLGSWLHAAAEQRRDCRCGLMSAEAIAAANREREVVLMGGDGGGAEGGEGRLGGVRAPEQAARAPKPAAPNPHDPAAVARAAGAAKKATFGDNVRAVTPFTERTPHHPVDEAALRRERARQATLEEIARVRAAACGMTYVPTGAPGTSNSASGTATTTAGERAAAAAERRRLSELAIDAAAERRRAAERETEARRDLNANAGVNRDDIPPTDPVRRIPQPPTPDDDEVVILSDDDGAHHDNRGFIDDFVARQGNRTREHPAMSTVGDRKFRLPPFPRGVTFSQVYDVVLIVDNREQFGGGRQRPGQTRSEHREEEVRRIASTHGILAEVRQLECGDATWVARRKPHHPGSNDDFILDFVVERKSLDDLKISIHDDRYRAQKFFLKKSGVRHVGYLVEGDIGKWGTSPGISEQSVKAVGSATVQTEIWDGFSVIRTEHVKETFDTYARMTVAMRELYGGLRESDGMKLGDGGVNGGVTGTGTSNASATSSHLPIPLTTYNANLTKTKRSLSTLRNVWGSMLMSTPGLGPEIAQAVIDRYPTPSSLNTAYLQCGADKEKAVTLLQGLSLTGNRTVGPLISKRVFVTLFGHELTPLAQRGVGLV